MPTEKTYASINRFPTIGRTGVVYVALDTGYKYIFNQGYKIQNPSVKTIQSEFGNLTLPLETVESTTTTFRKAEMRSINATDKIIAFPTNGNFFSTTIASLMQFISRAFGEYNTRVIRANETITIQGECERFWVQNLYNFGTLIINTTGNTEYGYGIARVDGILDNEGFIDNNGLIIT